MQRKAHKIHNRSNVTEPEKIEGYTYKKEAQ